FHDAPLTREVCDAARRYHLPILYDVGGQVAIAELLAEAYPDLDFIIPHLGSFADDWRAHIGLIDQLVRHPNIYSDTSGVRRFDLLEQAVQRAGSHKILFGSDGPWLHPGLELHKIRLLGLPPEQEQQICGLNLLRLLGKVKKPRQVQGAASLRNAAPSAILPPVGTAHLQGAVGHAQAFGGAL
ncbi:MAG: hypothetical protein RL748_427, partial [Pseudomonadota bacterium]